ncbi:MAG: hypothetical protein WBM50_25410 [Acidimicrobiales bacterium]
MRNYPYSKLTAVTSAIGFTSSLVLIFVYNDIWPWIPIVLGAIAVVLALKTVVAWRTDRPDVTRVEEALRLLASVGPDPLTPTAHAALDQYFDRLTRVEAHLNATGITWIGATDPTSHRRLPEGILAKEEEHAADLLSILETIGSRGV